MGWREHPQRGPQLGIEPHKTSTPPPDHVADAGATRDRDRPGLGDADPVARIRGTLTVIAPTDAPAITPLAARALLRILLAAERTRDLRARSDTTSPTQPDEQP
jgi:hypothetical protein